MQLVFGRETFFHLTEIQFFFYFRLIIIIIIILAMGDSFAEYFHMVFNISIHFQDIWFANGYSFQLCLLWCGLCVSEPTHSALSRKYIYTHIYRIYKHKSIHMPQYMVAHASVYIYTIYTVCALRYLRTLD